MAEKPYSTAAIVGCTHIGLASAQVLVEFFARVVIVLDEGTAVKGGGVPAELLADLRTHPQVRFAHAPRGAQVLLGPGSAHAIGVTFPSPDAPELSAVIADLVIEARGGPCRPVENLLCLPDAGPDRIAAALGAALLDQARESRQRNLVGLADRFKRQLSERSQA